MGDSESEEENTMTSADDIASMTVAKLVNNSDYKEMIKDIFAELMTPFITKVTNLEGEVEKLRGEVLELENVNKKLKKANKKHEKRIQTLESNDYDRGLDMIDMDQRMYRNSVIITGVPEPATASEEEENIEKVVTDLIKDKLDIDITEADIDKSVRFKQQQDTTKRRKAATRPIFVDFTRYNVRKKVIKARRKLKGTGMGIAENLSAGRQELLQGAQRLVDHFDEVRACWTWDGIVRISILEQGDTKEKRVKIMSYRDLNYWGNKFGNAPKSDSSSDEEEKK